MYVFLPCDASALWCYKKNRHIDTFGEKKVSKKRFSQSPFVNNEPMFNSCDVDEKDGWKREWERGVINEGLK